MSYSRALFVGIITQVLYTGRICKTYGVGNTFVRIIRFWSEKRKGNKLNASSRY
jgi:hypothetical protein